MIPRVLFCLALLFLTGCATMAARQTCTITSNPPGAAVYLVESRDEPATGRLLGTTPVRKWVQQGVATGYLRAELPGYQPVKWTLPDSLRFSHHFEMEPTYSAQVSAELASYPAEYVRAAIGVLGKCDEVLASPGMLAGTAAAVANTRNERLKFDFAEFRTSALARALDRAVDDLRRYGGLVPGSDDAASEAGAATRAQQLIGEIKQALGVR